MIFPQMMRPRIADFNPLSLSPTLWLDSSESSTITASGGVISSWADKSGSGNNMTASVLGPRAFWPGVSQNALNTTRIDTANTANSGLAKTTSLHSGVWSCALVVEKIITGTTVKSILIQDNTAAGASDRVAQYFRFYNGNLDSIAFATTKSAATASIPVSGSGYMIACAVRSASAIKLYSSPSVFSQAAITGTPAALSSNVRVGFGQGFSGMFPLGGSIAEIVLFNTDVTDSIASLFSYLSGKWGIA